MPTDLTTLQPFGYIGSTSIALDGTVKNLPTPPAGTIVHRARIQPQGADLRWRPAKATDPTASAGFLLTDGQFAELTNTSEFYGFRFVSAAGVGTLEVAWYGPAS